MRQNVSAIAGFVFTTVAAASLMLCVAALVLWPASYWRRFTVFCRVGQFEIDIQTEAGTLGLGRYQYPLRLPQRWGGTIRPLEADSYSGPFDFGHLHKARLRPDDNLFDSIWCPEWFAVAVFGAMPLVWMARFRRHRQRLRQGKCRSCGYDMRATPERCPECGKIPERSEAAA